MSLKLARVTVAVQDMDKQLAFYRDALGLPVKGDASDPNVVELDAGPCSILLVKGPRVTDASKLVLHGENVVEMREELELLGIKVGKLKAFGPHQAFDGTDPEGNPFQITNRP